MSNAVDMLKSILVRKDINNTRTKNRKQDNLLNKEFEKCFQQILLDNNDDEFFSNYENILSSRTIEPYVSVNFYPKIIDKVYENNFGFSNDFRFEIRLLIASIMFHKDTINEFVKCREKYDNLILLNKYEVALTLIEGFEKVYNLSYWTTECKFFLYNKLGKNVQDLLLNLEPTVFGTVLNYYELKNRDSVTSDEYYYIVEKEISGAKKHLQGVAEVIEFLDYSISGAAYNGTPDRILLAMKWIQSCSLVDRYIFLIRSCCELINHPKTNSFYQNMKAYINLLHDIEDDNLTAIRFVFDEDENKVKYILKNRLDVAKIKFILGDIKEARQEAVDLLTLFPNNIAAISLVVETNILLKDGAKQFCGTNLGMLIEQLASVYILNNKRDDAMEEINKLVLACSQSTWAQGIVSDIMSRCYETIGFEHINHKILCNLQHLDIETIISSLSKEECINFIDKKFDKKDEYIQFKEALICEEYERASDLCGINQIKDYLFVCNKNTTTKEKMEHLYPIDGTNSSFNIITMKQFILSIDFDKDNDILLKTVSNLIIDNIYTALFIPWERIISYINRGPKELRQNICTPIIYYVYAYYIARDKKDDLGIICNDFFNLEKIERPSKMKSIVNRYEQKFLVYFLKNVCNANTMDDALFIFDNATQRDQERVEICNLLTEIDNINEKEFEKEIRELTQKLMINKELQIIDESRIHVNVDGIREKLTNVEMNANKKFENSLKNDFQRYQFYQGKSFKQQLTLITQILEGEIIEQFDDSSKVTERLFYEIILKIRDEFVSSGEYGLEGYLSLNIRHNTLDDEFRSPLHNSNIYAKKDVLKKYIVPSRWTQFTDADDCELLQRAFGDFHTATESILIKLRTKYIQIKTGKKNEEGKFDYKLYQKDIESIYRKTSEITDFDEFLNSVINYFWSRTEYNLSVIKEVIKSEIAEDYKRSFASFKNNISSLKNSTIMRELFQKIDEAENDMQNVIEHVCHWFQRSNESKHSDFNLQFAFDLGLETIRNMHPTTKFVVDPIEETISDNIKGAYLKSYDGIFYNLFDNIYKKAKCHNGKIYIRYALLYSGEKIRIYLENDFDCSADISDDISRVENTKELYRTGKYLENANGEGGTGIHKICKICTCELRLTPPCVDFGYKIDENIFYIEIKN